MKLDRDSPEHVAEQFNVSRESLDRLQAYADLLTCWQKRINLIGPATADQVWSRHIADALQLIPLMGATPGSIADLGSGAGVPGLVLAIARPLTAHLFESSLKKAAFLREAARATGAKVIVHAIRIEAAGDLAREIKVRVVTARALAPLDQLLAYTLPFLKEGAIGLFHKGQDVDAELTKATKSWRLTFTKHPSITDSRGCILEVKEAHRVP